MFPSLSDLSYAGQILCKVLKLQFLFKVIKKLDSCMDYNMYFAQSVGMKWLHSIQ